MYGIGYVLFLSRLNIKLIKGCNNANMIVMYTVGLYNEDKVAVQL